MTHTLRGTVEAVLFEDTRGFVALRCRVQGQAMRVVGVLGRVHVGEPWMLTGHWEDHPHYGRQFRLTAGAPALPQTSEDLVALLSGPDFPGIGPATAARVVRAYGDQLWEVLEQDPHRLEQEGHVTVHQSRRVLTAVSAYRARWNLMRFLVDHSLPLRLFVPLSTLYPADAVARLTDNPYRLLAFCGWAVADRVACQQGVPRTDRRRLEAALVATLQDTLGAGHTALPRRTVIQRTSQQAKVPSQVVSAIFPTSVVTQAAGDMLQLPGIASQEPTIATMCAALVASPQPLADRAWIDQWLDRYTTRTGRTLDDDQRAAVRAAGARRLLVLTGGPGTGKTTTVDAIRSLLHALGQVVVMAAPTGRAARRVQQATGQETTTLHRLFGYAQRRFTFEKADATLPTLIVDESSMVELRLWGCVANATSVYTRLILVGDAGQLPPVGPGAVYAGLVYTPRIPVTRLSTIHRQATDNPIPHVAAAIRRGEVPDLPAWSGERTGVFLLYEPDERRGGEEAVRLATQGLPARGFPMHHVQILTPRRVGVSGTTHLNAAVRSRLGKVNVSPAIPYAAGDRVIQTMNDYDLGASGIMNGTTGTVAAVGETGITVDFEGEDVHVTGASLANLDYGYALTVHRSQGSQYPVVILPLYGHDGATLLSRHVLYTAITRAEHLVVVLGTPDTLAAAVGNNAPAERVTGFPTHLEEALAAIVPA